MTALSKGSFSKQTEYTISYSSMRGVDFSSQNNISGRERFSYLENMYRDYDGEGAEITESIPGFRRISALGERINGLYLQKGSTGDEYIIVHAGKNLYRFNIADRDSLTALSSLKTINDSKSSGFSFGTSAYILDGETITRIDEEGNASTVLDGSDAHGYIPTTYVNGEEYEQLNLLTKKFYEEYFVAFPEDVAYSSDGIKYKITDRENKKCTVIGLDASFSGHLYIPSYATIGTERYEVSSIEDFSFTEMTSILSVTIGEGITAIGNCAFQNCTGLKKAILPDSVTSIGNSCFTDCTSLATIRLGTDLSVIGNLAFSNCSALMTVQFAFDESRFNQISNIAALGNQYNLVTYVKNTGIRAKIPVTTPTETVMEVFVEDESVDFSQVTVDGAVTAVIILNIEKSKLEASTVRIRGYAHQTKFKFNTPGVNFISGIPENMLPSEVIKKCTVCECFDGRVFLSGNPNYPNTVFYSARDSSGNNNPLYFGVMNYFNDGVGGFPVISMLAAGDSLAVFKAGDDGGGSIFYHTPRETGIDILPKIYPVSYVHSGISAIGESISFFDDPIFISSAGVCALDKKAINLERSIVCRSHNINPSLLANDLSEVSFAEWCGYLAVSVGGKIYLADSRSLFVHETGNTEYEWYYLNGIGTYSSAENVYKYASNAEDGFYVNEDMVDQKVTAEIYSVYNGSWGFNYYTEENSKKYQVIQTKERTGGIFNPATKLLGVGNKLLFFGTASGEICIFNNDKRGVAPDWLAKEESFDAEIYKSLMGRRIHPDFYSFAGHAPRYALSTVMDDCSIPYLTKNTVKNSLTLKCRAFGRGSFICEAGTNGSGYKELASFPDANLDFSDLDFSSLTFFVENHFTIPIAEKQKGWVEKQISIYSDSYASPFGIYSMSYRFTVKGRIKKTKT